MDKHNFDSNPDREKEIPPEKKEKYIPDDPPIPPKTPFDDDPADAHRRVDEILKGNSSASAQNIFFDIPNLGEGACFDDQSGYLMGIMDGLKGAADFVHCETIQLSGKIHDNTLMTVKEIANSSLEIQNNLLKDAVNKLKSRIINNDAEIASKLWIAHFETSNNI